MIEFLERPVVVAKDELSALAAEINKEHEAGELLLKKGMDHYRRAGELLLKVKNRVGHGHFMKWLKDNVTFTDDTARNYMNVARNWDSVKDCGTMSEALGLNQKPNNSVFVNNPDADAPAVTLPHVAHNSGVNEWYTPQVYLDAARDVMGEITLDPATSEVAQERVKAKRHFTQETNGLDKNWKGKVWMNPPYASELIGRFTNKLGEHYRAGDVSEAVVLVNNATETGWFQSLPASAICFPTGRIKFLDPSGNPAGAPLQGQALVYLGKNANSFAERFKQFGLCVGVV